MGLVLELESPTAIESSDITIELVESLEDGDDLCFSKVAALAAGVLDVDDMNDLIPSDPADGESQAERISSSDEEEEEEEGEEEEDDGDEDDEDKEVGEKDGEKDGDVEKDGTVQGDGEGAGGSDENGVGDGEGEDDGSRAEGARVGEQVSQVVRDDEMDGTSEKVVTMEQEEISDSGESENGVMEDVGAEAAVSDVAVARDAQGAEHEAAMEDAEDSSSSSDESDG